MSESSRLKLLGLPKRIIKDYEMGVMFYSHNVIGINKSTGKEVKYCQVRAASKEIYEYIDKVEYPVYFATLTDKVLDLFIILNKDSELELEELKDNRAWVITYNLNYKDWLPYIWLMKFKWCGEGICRDE